MIGAPLALAGATCLRLQQSTDCIVGLTVPVRINRNCNYHPHTTTIHSFIQHYINKVIVRHSVVRLGGSSCLWSRRQRGQVGPGLSRLGTKEGFQLGPDSGTFHIMDGFRSQPSLVAGGQFVAGREGTGEDCGEAALQVHLTRSSSHRPDQK